VRRPSRWRHIEILECAEEVLGMLFANILDAKVIEDEQEGNVASVVVPKSWGARSWDIAVLGKMILKLLVGDDAACFKPYMP
jgi:hypothetical protein